MSSQVVIALDQGSSSSRALAIDSRGKVVARAQFPIKTFYPEMGCIQHDPLDIARTAERALDQVLRRLPRSTEVLGVGLACQRSTIVFWDKETGKPTRSAPSWQDGRAAAIVAPMQDRQADVHDRTGLYLTPYYSAPKIRWFLENDLETRRLFEKGRLLVGPVSSFLIWRLTQGEVFAVDPTMAQRMMLFNIRSLDWDASLLELFSVDRGTLPKIVASAGSLGMIERQGRKIPLLAAIGDQQAANYSLGAEEGAAVANYGTGAFFILNTGARQHRIPGLLTSVAWKFDGKEPVFMQEGTVHAAGTSFDWLRDNLGLLRPGQDIDALCRASTQRVLALQAIGGLGAPRWDYTTKTVFFGMNSQTKPADLVRGVAEGVAFLIGDIFTALESGSLKPSAVLASGGLSRISHLMQFQADLLGVEIRRCKEPETTAMGAAALAASAAGVPWAARLRGAKFDRVFKPAISADKSARLRSGWKSFVDAQALLSVELRDLPER